MTVVQDNGKHFTNFCENLCETLKLLDIIGYNYFLGGWMGGCFNEIRDFSLSSSKKLKKR